MNPRINIIAAIGKDTRALGRNGELIWKIPADMERFKELTTGHPVIMGRATWDSIPKKFRPLPKRTNIVVTRNLSLKIPKAFVAHSLSGAMQVAMNSDGNNEIFVIGGSEIYHEAMPLAHRLYLTLVESEEVGDVFFPEYENKGFHQTLIEQHTESKPHYAFTKFER